MAAASRVSASVLRRWGQLIFKKHFDELLRTVQESLKLITIVLDQADDANAIFSRLNAKGVPLALSDLVRNEVFSKFKPHEGKRADDFFNKHWHPFEKSFPDDSLNGFFPVFAYIFLRGKTTKAAAFSHLQAEWRDKKPSELLAGLERYSPYFIALSQFRMIPRLPMLLNEQVERFSRMPRSRVTWPFIIEVLHAVAERRTKEKDAIRTLSIVESFLVRRALIGMEPTGLHAVFKVLWEKTKGNPANVVQKIVTRTIQSPSDAQLMNVLSGEASDSRVILRFVPRSTKEHLQRLTSVISPQVPL